MCNLAFGVILIGVVSYGVAQSNETVDYRLSGVSQVQTRAMVNHPCKSVGLMCQDCNSIKLCTRNYTSDEFQEEIIGSCDQSNNETCLNGQCVTGSNPVCLMQDQRFRCTSDGIFPDPIDCQTYHICIMSLSNPDNPMTCSSTNGVSYGFSACTNSCNNRLYNNKCPATTPVPMCKKMGQTGTVLGCSNRYYICKQVVGTDGSYLYPDQYLCPNGKRYNNNFACI